MGTKKYKCQEGHVHHREELTNWYGDGYDQMCCPDCGDLMFDDLHGNQYCEEVN